MADEDRFDRENRVAIPGRVIQLTGSASKPSLDDDPLDNTGVGKPTRDRDSLELEGGIGYPSESQGVVLSNADYSEDSPLILTVKTDNSGSSNNDQFILYLFQTETYDFTWKTSDGTSGSHSSDSDLLFTFPSGAGTYDIEISGTFPRIYNNTFGDSTKIVELKQMGTIIWKSFVRAFFGCSNMDITATDSPNLSQVKDYTFGFTGCTSISDFPAWDVSAGEDFTLTWAGCTFTSFPKLNYASAITLFRTWFFCTSLASWDGTTSTNLESLRETWQSCPLTSFPFIITDNVTDMAAAWVFADFTTFPLLNTSKCEDFEGSWFGVKDLNLPAIDTSVAENMFDCFRNGNGLVLAAPLDLRSLVAGTSTGGHRMYENTNIGNAFWDATLIATNTNNPNTDVYLHGGSAKYTSGGSAEAARDALIARVPSWKITDGGAV